MTANVSIASPVPISGMLTNAELRTSPVPVSGPLTDAALRSAPVPMSGTVTVGNFPATQPVSAAALPLPSGASTETTLALIKAKTDNLDVALSTRAVTGLTDGQLRATPVPISGTVMASGPLTDTQLRAAAVQISDSERGTWGYVAGVSGTVNIAANRRVLRITAHATLAASLTINGGDSVPIAAGITLSIEPKGNLIAPTIVFTSTSSYFVESVI